MTDGDRVTVCDVCAAVWDGTPDHCPDCGAPERSLRYVVPRPVSHTESAVCTGCGWVQSFGSGSFVLTCPECGGTSWRPLEDADAPE